MNNITNGFGKPIKLSTITVDEIIAENTRLKAELVSFQLERNIRRMAEANEGKLHAKVDELKSLLKEATDLIKEVYPLETVSLDKQTQVKKKLNRFQQVISI